MMRLAAAAMAFVAVLGAASAEAYAQFYGRSERQWIIETPGPARGYSGFVGPRNYYCDYVRYPNRQCVVDRAGRERCRIVGWRMVQRCT